MLFLSTYMAALEAGMLALDPTEVREETRLIVGDLSYVTVPWLEKLTGADMVVSALEAPMTTPALLRMHLHHGAVLVQRKHRTDLVSSLDVRLKASLAKMRAFGARQPQCVLLFIGVLTCDRDGKAMIDGQDVHRNFWSVYAGLAVWIKHGGVVEPPLSRATLFPDWVKFKVRHIADMNAHPRKDVIQVADPVYEVDPDDPVQELVLVKDWRATMMQCPGWGIARVNALRNLMLKDKVPDTLITALDYVTSGKITAVPGFGQYLIDNTCKWLGIAKNSQIQYKEAANAKSKPVGAAVARPKPRNRRA